MVLEPSVGVLNPDLAPGGDRVLHVQAEDAVTATRSDERALRCLRHA